MFADSSRRHESLLNRCAYAIAAILETQGKSARHLVDNCANLPSELIELIKEFYGSRTMKRESCVSSSDEYGDDWDRSAELML